MDDVDVSGTSVSDVKAAILDSGTSLLVGPKEDVKKIAAKVVRNSRSRDHVKRRCLEWDVCPLTRFALCYFRFRFHRWDRAFSFCIGSCWRLLWAVTFKSRSISPSFVTMSHRTCFESETCCCCGGVGQSCFFLCPSCVVFWHQSPSCLCPRSCSCPC